MGEKCNGFYFPREFRDAIRAFPATFRVKLYDAIMDYTFDGIEPELDDIAAKAMFILIKADIDAEHR